MNRLRATVEVLTQAEMEQIHNAALSVLEKTGMHVPHDEVLRRCQLAGAVVESPSQVVRFPRSVMEDLITHCRKDKHERFKTYPLRDKIYGGISTQVFIVDYGKKERRYGVMDDIKKGIALVEKLDNIPNSNAVCVASDVDPKLSDVAAYHTLFTYSKKPGGTYVVNPTSAQYIMDMAESLGRKEFYLFESISPLRFRKETLEMGLAYADRGHYLGIAPMIVGGTTGPITYAGIMTLVTAEVLGSLFICMALTGEKPSFYGHGSHSNDPSTLLCSFGSPSQALIGIATAQIAEYYGMYAGSNSALTDALLPDFQGGFEKAASMIFSCLAGTCSIGCQGIAGADQGFSFEQLLIDNEWLDYYNYIVSGFEVNEETIAETLIHEIGIGGHFIESEHTVQHLRDSWWRSKLFDRYDWDAWVTRGAKDLFTRAHDLVTQYTAHYKDIPMVVTPSQADDLDKIFALAQKKAKESSL